MPSTAGAGFFTISTETQALFAAMDRLGDLAERLVKEQSAITARRIVREAQRRVARRTGETASHIVDEESHDKKGYIVWVEPDVLISLHTSQRTGRTHTQKVTYNALGGWLEFGTQFMTPRPFLYPSVQLEQAGHLRRVQGAIQDAIEETGLGD